MVVWGEKKKQKQREASYIYKLNMNFKIYLILSDKTKQGPFTLNGSGSPTVQFTGGSGGPERTWKL